MLVKLTVSPTPRLAPADGACRVLSHTDRSDRGENIATRSFLERSRDTKEIPMQDATEQGAPIPAVLYAAKSRARTIRFDAVGVTVDERGGLLRLDHLEAAW
jgi:hypothetical protein